MTTIVNYQLTKLCKRKQNTRVVISSSLVLVWTIMVNDVISTKDLMFETLTGFNDFQQMFRLCDYGSGLGISIQNRSFESYSGHKFRFAVSRERDCIGLLALDGKNVLAPSVQ